MCWNMLDALKEVRVTLFIMQWINVNEEIVKVPGIHFFFDSKLKEDKF